MRASTRSRPCTSKPSSVLAYDIETIAPQSEDGSFPAWPLHRPIAIGFAAATCREGSWSFDIEALVIDEDTTEADLIRAADARMAEAVVKTGYNSAQFDALVLRLAAQRSRVWDARALADHAAASRYGGDHADLADLYASFGRKVSLTQLCEAVGIPAKTDVSGKDVAALWQAGETERIRRYVMEDAAATLVLYFAWEAARRADESLVTRPLAALAQHIETTPSLESLQPFIDCGLIRWCRPRALKADVAAAITRISARVRRDEDERLFAMP